MNSFSSFILNRADDQLFHYFLYSSAEPSNTKRSQQLPRSSHPTCDHCLIDSTRRTRCVCAPLARTLDVSPLVDLIVRYLKNCIRLLLTGVSLFLVCRVSFSSSMSCRSTRTFCAWTNYQDSTQSHVTLFLFYSFLTLIYPFQQHAQDFRIIRSVQPTSPPLPSQ